MIRESELVRNRYRPGLYDFLKIGVGGAANHYYDGFQVTGLDNIKDDQSNLFLMNHRSHFDYLFLNYILFINKKEIPYIVARDNIFKYMFFGGVLNQLARTVTVRSDLKSISEYKKYSRELKKDITRIIDQNQDFAVFLEGGRDYKGGFGEPQTGVLKKVLKTGKNMLAIPTYFVYSYVVESEFFEKLKKAKKGSFNHVGTDVWAFIKNGLKVFSSGVKNGKIHIHFGEGFELEEYLGQKGAPKLVCDRAWEEILQAYKPPATAHLVKKIEDVNTGESKDSLEKILTAPHTRESFNILKARRVLDGTGRITNPEVWRYILNSRHPKRQMSK